jgi:hypothetical protein
MEDKSLLTSTGDDSTPLTPAELVKKHSSNRDHIISENEMRNLKIGDDATDSTELDRALEEKDAENNTGHHENNTYDIFDA